MARTQPLQGGGKPPNPRTGPQEQLAARNAKVTPWRKHQVRYGHGDADQDEHAHADKEGEVPPLPDSPPADMSQPQPPPPGGGWGWTPSYGWGYFPMTVESLPPGQRPEPPAPALNVLLFEETFSGGALNQKNWWTRYIYSGPDGPGTLDYLNDEYERYRETGNHVVGANGIALSALPNNGSFNPSGMLRSKDLFDLASGKPFYFECRARVPKGRGTWDAFWLSADARSAGDVSTVFWPPEIDIMEIVNNGAEDTTTMLGCRCQVLNWGTNPQQYWVSEVCDSFNAEFMVWYAPFDFADEHHTFGLFYQRPNFTFLCDGGVVAKGQYDWVWDDGSPAPPAHVLVNLAIGGSWAGRHGVDDSAFPQALDVEFVRVWSTEQMDLPRDTIGVDYEIT